MAQTISQFPSFICPPDLFQYRKFTSLGIQLIGSHSTRWPPMYPKFLFKFLIQLQYINSISSSECSKYFLAPYIYTQMAPHIISTYKFVIFLTLQPPLSYFCIAIPYMVQKSEKLCIFQYINVDIIPVKSILLLAKLHPPLPFYATYNSNACNTSRVR